jgi:hypothetical protein
MTCPLSLAAAAALPALLLSGSLVSETNARISGDAAGPSCDVVAVAVMRMTLRYPLLGGSGWGRGVPTITSNTADLYLFNATSRTLNRVARVEAPRRWRDSSRYAMQPRVLPDGSVIFMLRGCPKGHDNCSEARYFRVQERGEPMELPAWPDITAQESLNLKQCTSYLTYEASTVNVNIGPTGGPWRQVLKFDRGELGVLPQ